LSQAKRSLKDATAVNSTRWALFNRLSRTGLPVSTGSGGLTKFNRTRLSLAKTHWLDAACVGNVESLKILTNKPLLIKATGHGTRQMCRTDKFGFPCRFPGLSLLKVFKLEILSKQSLLLARKLVNMLGVLPLERVVHLIFPHQNWCQGLATNIVQLFTERMVIRMQHKPCPPWTPTTLPEYR